MLLWLLLWYYLACRCAEGSPSAALAVFIFRVFCAISNIFRLSILIANVALVRKTVVFKYRCLALMSTLSEGFSEQS